MRIHATTSGSLANGPGRSFVIWTQGCSRRCEGCCNPETWDPEGGIKVPLVDLFEKITSERDIDTVVFSGGEPLDQADMIAPLLCGVAIERPELRWVLFTGYSGAAIHAHYPHAFEDFDLIVAGPYDRTCPRTDGDPPLLASKNQELIFPSGRLSLADLKDIPDVEYLLDDDKLVRTGVGAADLGDGM